MSKVEKDVNSISEAFKECVDISMQADSESGAKRLFWDAFKEKTGSLPSEDLAGFTEDFLFNMNKKSFELRILVPFTDEMLDSAVSDGKAKHGRYTNSAI